MLSAYNAGPAGGIQSDYVAKVLANAKSWGAESPSAGSKASGGQERTPTTFKAVGGPQGASDETLALISQLQGELRGTTIPHAAQASVPTPSFYPQALGGGPISGIAPRGKESNLPAIVQALQQSLASGSGSETKVAAQPGARGAAAPAQQGAPASGGYPLGKVGKVIGTPYTGTHTLGNWESDNAIDLAVPKGTPVYATQNGTIGSQIGSLGSGNPRFAGERLHLVAPNNEWYYAHLSRIVVKAGQRVREGQLLGYSGEANGVAHLHIASKHGSPTSLTKR